MCILPFQVLYLCYAGYPKLNVMMTIRLTVFLLHIRVCFQLSEGLSTIAQGFLEEFVNSWRYMDDQYYPLSGAEARVADKGGSRFTFSISVDKYLEVVELYVVTLLATTLKDTGLAISWVEKAMLPMENRQVTFEISLPFFQISQSRPLQCFLMCYPLLAITVDQYPCI